MRFEIFTAMKIWIVVFWVVTLCSLGDGYQRFGGVYRLHLQGTIKMEAILSSKPILVTTHKITRYHNPECRNTDNKRVSLSIVNVQTHRLIQV
jgi:hypothetical protein